jgi:hypothetical protein
MDDKGCTMKGQMGTGGKGMMDMDKGSKDDKDDSK